MKHLTDKQKQRIFDTAMSLIFEDVERNQDYLDCIIRHYVSSHDIKDQLAMISSEEECQANLLGFHPETGKSYHGI